MIDRRLKLEPLERRRLLAADFGDAPEPYPTLLADNGARHEAVGPMLGTSRDSEADGQASEHGDGDAADEDGVTFGVMRAGQLAATMTLQVTNVVGTAKLDAWIDFNGDGSWGGGNERIVANEVVSNGLNTVRFDIPVDARSGVTYARVRLSTDGGLGYRGAAPDGEVEDYEVTIVSPRQSSGELGARQLLVGQSFEEGVLSAVDLDQDGDVDLVGISASHQLFWYENQLEVGVVPHEIGSGTSFYYLNSNADMSVGDIDSDGDLDLVTVLRTQSRSTVVTSINDGNQTFQHQAITHIGSQAQAVELADISGDGTLEVYSGLELSPEVPGPIRDLKFADIERDGDLDILVGFDEDEFDQALALYENDGTGSFNYREIRDNSDLDAISIADINGDAKLDILEASRKWLVLEVQDSSLYSSGVVLSDHTFNDSLSAVDMDGDGDFDILPSLPYYRDSVLWLENVYSDTAWYFDFPEHWVPSVSTSLTVPADLDGDGDIDVIAAGEEGIFWHENLGSAVSVSVYSPSVAERSGEEVHFEFTRSGDISRALSVDFLVGGASEYLTDYTVEGASAFSDTTGKVIFAAGASTAEMIVRPASDSQFESDEQLRIELIDGDDYAFVGDPIAAVSIIDPADFGDAPFSYATGFLQSGARHNPVGPRLGSLRDQEYDGQPNSTATGDDFGRGASDEDGVALTALQVGNARESVEVTVSGADQGARLDAWIDFDGDGTWSGQWEQIADSVAIVNGVNTIYFAVPGNAKSGTTYARFRLSTQGGLGPKDLALDGEVEDYVVELEPPVSSAALFSSPKSFDATSNLTIDYSHAVVDFDRDGDFDIISADFEGFFWQENLGGERFVTRTLGPVTDYVGELQPADLDSDGDIDLAVASSDAISWFENVDGELQIKHQLLDLTEGVLGGSQSGYAIAVADMDRDGDLDLVSGVNNTAPFGSEQADYYWHVNDGAGAFTSHYIDSVAAARNHFISHLAINTADVDQDGDPDIVCPVDEELLWFENTSQQFVERSISYLGNGLGDRFDDAVVADFDGDGDSDVVSIERFGSRMSFHANSGLPFQVQFFRSTILTADSFDLSQVSAADMDGDGDLDLLVASRISDDGVNYLLLNDGSGAFSARVISDLKNRYADPMAIDVDNDGDLDIAHSGLMWLENVNSVPSADFDGDGRVGGRDFLLWQRGHGASNAFFGQGDANNDLAVDGPDLAVWRVDYGTSSVPQLPGDFDADGDVDGRDFLAWQRGASPTPLAGNDLADWQATYGYTAPEPLAALSSDATAEPTSEVAAVVAVDEVLAAAPPVMTLPLAAATAVSRESELVRRESNHERTRDHVFSDLGTPSRTFIRDFGDIAVRRTRPQRLSVGGSVAN